MPWFLETEIKACTLFRVDASFPNFLGQMAILDTGYCFAQRQYLALLSGVTLTLLETICEISD